MKRGNISKAAAVRNSSTISLSLNADFNSAVEGIVDVLWAAMQAVGQAEAQFFFRAERAIFEIGDAGDLRLAGAFFLRGDGLGAVMAYSEFIRREMRTATNSLYQPVSAPSLSNGFRNPATPLAMSGNRPAP